MKNIILGMWLMVISPFFLKAQNIPTPVSFRILSENVTVKTGEPFTIDVAATIDDPWHLYSVIIDGEGPIPTQFSVKTVGFKLNGKVAESAPKIVFDPNFSINVGWHSNEATFKVPVIASKAGNFLLEIGVRYMVCDDKSCQPPRSIVVSVPVHVTGENLAEVETIEISESVVSEYGGSFWSFLWIAITAGFAALLTPCVFPMIPLTVSFFTKQTDGSARKAVGQAFLFGASIIGLFTLLGVLLSLFIGAAGANQFAANPWVNLFIGVIFVLFAFSLLGLFELQLPYWITNYLNRKSEESSGITGILFMGLTISAVSFSCTAPFVGGVLAATSTGEWFYPIIGMLGFSAAFSTPFIFFAMFPKAMSSLPRSGQWMNTVKVLLGFVELAAAFKFISNADLVWQWGIISRPIALAFWIAISFFASFYLLGILTMPHEKKQQDTSFWRVMGALGFFAFAVYLLPGLMGASLGIWDAWLPPKQATDVSLVSGFSVQRSGTAEHDWYATLEDGTKAAEQSGKFVLIDFTGYTCTNCRAMESNIFPLQGVRERFEKFEKVQLYTDDGVTGPANQMYQFKLTGTVSLPTYAVIDATTGKLIDKLSGYASEKEFTAFLDKTIAKMASN